MILRRFMSGRESMFDTFGGKDVAVLHKVCLKCDAADFSKSETVLQNPL
jgi:hypothetical protein